MISGSGYGLFLVILIYVGGPLLVYWPFANASRLVQMLSLVCTNIVCTVLSYLLAKRLNRDGVKHTVWGVRLEKVVLVLGGGLLWLSLIMLLGEF